LALAENLATEEKRALDEKKLIECLALSEQIANAEKLATATLSFLHTPLEPYTYSITQYCNTEGHSQGLNSTEEWVGSG
jgi:hypothetical protein